MLPANRRCGLFVLAAAVLLAATCHALRAQAGSSQDKTPPTPAPIPRMTIEVTGGDTSQPVENASVYIKYVEERTFRKDKKYELNVKTNREGVTHVPDSPLGKVMIQVIAQGWKTYGRWYEITEPRQTVQIHLERPPKWY